MIAKKGKAMARFTDKLCPVCRISFKDGDDVVVCPECGAPHHRACYRQLGRCGVEGYHGTGYVWEGRLPDETEAQPQQDEVPIAQQDEHINNPHHAELPNYSQTDDSAEIPELRDIKELSPYFDMYKKIRELTDDEKRGEDGVSSKELCHFVGRSVVHYSQAFSAFRVGVPKNGGIHPVKVFINLCAGLFYPIHQFYRRMDVLAVLLLLVSVVTSIPDFVLFYDSESTAFQLSPSSVAALDRIAAICSFVNFVVTLLLCVFGDYIYYKFCVRRIKQIRANYDDGNAAGYYAALTEHGAPSKLRIVIGILATMLVSQLAYNLTIFLLI